VFEFSLLGIPVRVQPWFFLTALLIGPRDLTGLALWLPVVFLGVLAHELGHAAAVRRFGLAPAIELHGFGGVTSWRGAGGLSPARRIAISAAGPGVGLAIGTATLIASVVLEPQQPLVLRLVAYVAWVNLGWGLLNLLPVLPLDGGSIAASLSEAAWGQRGIRVARILSLVVCIALGLWARAAGWVWSAIIAGVLALANLQALRAPRSLQPPGNGYQ
jgi:Zn-dependent protease